MILNMENFKLEQGVCIAASRCDDRPASHPVVGNLGRSAARTNGSC